MKITFKLYAMLSDYLPPEGRKDNQVELDVNEDTTVGDVIQRFNLPERLTHLVLINGAFVPPAERIARKLNEGDTLAIWPPIAGG